MVPRLTGKRHQKKGSSMKKMLVAVACLGMGASVDMFAKAPDLLEAVTAIDTLGKSDASVKQIKSLMTEAKNETEPIKKAAKGIMAADLVYKNITMPLEVIFRGLASNSVINKATKGYLTKAADKLTDMNKSLQEFSSLADLLAVMGS